eukprot:m.158361 g.158361  ORF g.158361 m.158361 type:complete len:369 (+) comp38734_c1_seq23:589-1695(+)
MAKVCPNPDGSLHMNILCAVNVSQQPEGSLPDIQSTGYALELLKNFSKNSEQPFFLAVGYHKPHVPLKFPEQYLDQYPLSDISLPTNKRYPPGLPTVAWEPWTDVRRREDVMALNLSFPYGPMLDNFAQKIIQHYYASTTYVDSELGRLLKGLKDSGLENNTIISFIGDHGWQLGENQEWAKYSNFETAVRVPLILRLPERSSGPVFVNGLVELVDLLPSLSELCGLDVPKQCPGDSSDVTFCSEGLSFVPLLSDRNASMAWKQAAFSQYPRPSDLPKNDSDCPRLVDIKIMGYSMRTDHYRYTEWVGYDSQRFKQNWDDVHAHELYDHSDGSREDQNLAYNEAYAGIVKELSSRLRKGWRAALPTYL